jgi:sortase B
MKKIINFFIYILKTTSKGFCFLCTILSKGFFFYPKQFFVFLSKIFKKSMFFEKCVKHYGKRQLQPEFCLLIILYFAAACTLTKILYVKPVEVVHNDFDSITKTSDDKDSVDNNSADSDTSSNNSTNSGVSITQDSNLFRRYAETSLDQVNISQLKESNSDTVAWLSVDGTTINYPIVQTTDNDYYLSHSYDRSKKKTGWTFMDYRNDPNLSDNNTIFYGHNLFNKTAFGSISNIFSKDWQKNSNKSIMIITENKKYYYTIFSAYYVAPEVYYLQNVFYDTDSYQEFLNTISSRNILNIDSSVNVNDKIITLSTCSDDNTGRKVVHAKLVAVY